MSARASGGLVLPLSPPRLPPALARLLVGGGVGAALAGSISGLGSRLGAAPLVLGPAGAAVAGAVAAGAVAVLHSDDPDRCLRAAPPFFVVQSISLTPLPAAVAGGVFLGLVLGWQGPMAWGAAAGGGPQAPSRRGRRRPADRLL